MPKLEIKRGLPAASKAYINYNYTLISHDTLYSRRISIPNSSAVPDLTEDSLKRVFMNPCKQTCHSFEDEPEAVEAGQPS